ncbi:Cytochrome oxidase assembly factor 4 [Zancudomyces culisetae]|uniref:Cytochrome oxidase assembly factor 4 n=1 Tax=Zancudomyces culisetae TaxID=1213189 RepID=A0A1R1PI96_ZANCU|nr:Cytochrome oxidase assembly factor 4 [Zancudomyces culisetae]|eukprot:OMH80700.1 Cytochrome oxidase assembly factor 4 [Zancudomyces culisetae]
MSDIQNKNIQIEDDEEDEWDARIRRTGCHKENEALLICKFDTKDWRKCTKELKAFKDCMDNYMNHNRN